ncbi:non-ribosomal peptide synthetase [Caballeronia sp. LZ034LL]|uniref:non-ribosomal peptide synthetase n=1 Tax=Caballeronia sp. LZ034LL TaxID=3038567 RepID=UPI002854E12B|nr:non-ribosomal peptide synthetase [Caballeronia sp. LZ034LL]MDR5835735.1 amino acid adenylation domain-containing protein [Caballeronia sp. LZ034LL]
MASQAQGADGMDMAENMIERLRTLAASRGTDTALVTVDAHGDTRYDYAQLDRRATALARRLRGADGWTEGMRVLLMMDSGIDYVAAFFGCLYAGATAVPAYPPESRRGQHLARLQAIAADADAAFIVTTDALEASLGDAFAEIAPQAMRVSMDALVADPDASSFEPYRAAPADVAFLQYTSGSTSSPKGVMVTHGSLWANEAAIRAGLSVTGDDVFVSWLPLYHDMGLIGTLSQPVFSGIPLVLMSPQYFLERPVRWLEAIARHRGTISGGPDFAYRLCADRVGDEQRDALDLSSWRVAFSGSEPVRKPTLDAFVARFASAQFDAGALFPCYGLAEATLYVSGVARGAGARAASFDPAAMEQGRVAVAAGEADSAALVSCGKAAPEHEIAIVDTDSGAVLGPGRIGEICVSGPSVAAGYWRREDASASAFRTRGGVTWLHTGDLGFQHDGELYVAGRIKDLLIVRGRNLYPQDLELAIEREVELVRRGRVAAFAVEIDGQAGIGIAAEVSPKMRKLIAAQDIAAALTEAVAQTCGETAGAIVLLDPGGLPKTSSGKVQRAACALGWQKRSLDAYAWFLQGRRIDSDEAPQAALVTLDEMEAALAVLWRDALPGDGALAADANFFAHGGNSLAAVQVAAAIRARWPIDFMPRDVFAAPVLRDAAACVRERMAHAAQGQAQTEALPLLDDAQRTRSRASDAQRGLWLTWSHDPSSAAYNMSGVLRLHGALDVAALQRAFQTVVKQHDILRACFVIDDEGEAVQLIDDTLDITLGHSCDEGTFEALADRIARAPFDLEAGPLVRAHLVSVGENEHRLVLALHHIIADGWSVNVLLAALADAYYARPELTQRRVQSADYTAWSRASADASTLARQLDYWRTQLAADGDPAQAARLFPAAADATRGRQRSAMFALEADLADRMRRLAGEHRASLFMTVLAVFNVVLHELSGKDDIRIGAPVSSRKRPEAQHLIGYFIDMQVLRSRVERQQDFGALVDAARETVLAAQEHQDVPFDRLMSALLPKRAQAGDALFQVKLTEQRPFAAHGFAPLDASLHVLLNDAPHFDLAVDFTDTGAQIDFLVAYDDAVFDAAFIARLTRLFATLAQRLTDAPQEAIGRHLDEAPSADVLTMWADSVARHPDKIALRDGARSATFAELDAAASVLAARLIDHGAVREVRVGVLAERSIEHVLGMLAALKAGATWVPLDPSAPAARLSAQLRDCGARVLLHAAALPEGLDTAQAVLLGVSFAAGENTQAKLPCVVHPDQAAYMIYTSGSTGEPKGVVVSHRALGSYVRGMLDTLRASPDASFAMVSTPAADLGHTVLFGALCSARTLHLLAPELAFNPDQFARYMAEHEVGVLKIVPGHLSALLSAACPRDVLPWDALIVGGETTSAALLSRLQALEPACRIFNHYGPTETTVGVAMYAQRGPLDAQRDLPLGAALPGARLHVLDDALQPVEPGAIGELYVGGPSVARGYHGRAALSAERFVPDPFASGERLYRTGDRVRIHADGMLDYLGRADDQLKVRGYRVEPAEVERALRRVEGVREAAVFGHDAAGGLRLAAIVTGDATADTVRGALAAWLPEYMVPADIVTVAALPLNANGKLDRLALRTLLPTVSESAPADAADAPHGATEVALAQIWAEVIGMEPGSISRHRNFFESGGDSILGLKVVAKARKARLSITPKLLFQRLTLAQLAARLDEASAVKAAPQSTIPRLPDAARGRTLASHAQQRQWFMWQLAPESSAYHVAGGLWLSGDVDASALRASVEAIVARHEVLRTRFVADDAGHVQQWIEPQGTLDWQEASLPATQIDDAARLLASRPFDLAQGPLLRAGLFHTQEEGKSLFVLAMHHIVSDGWSVRVLLEELVAHYRAAVLKEPLKLSALPVQYADYAAWQRDWLEAGEREQQLTYWRKALGDTQPVLALPTDSPRQANASYRAARYRLRMPQALSQAVKSRAQGTSTTPFMVLLAAFQALLHRYTGQEDIRIGVPVANRHRVETEGLIGFFVNTQVLRAEIDGEASLEALLQQTRQTTLDAQAHQDLPFDVLVDALRPERSLSHTPLFQVMFNHQRSDWRVLEQLPGLTIELYPLPAPMAQFELLLDTREEPDGTLSLELTYARELFDEPTIARLAQHYQRILAAFADAAASHQSVGEIAMVDEAEAATLARWSVNPAHNEGAEPVFRAFERHAERHPDDIALLLDDATLTYGELNARANRLAHWLLAQGVGVETRVGIAALRSFDLLVALYAIVKAGAAYVPLDPSYPADRLAYMIGDSWPQLVLHQRGIELPALDGGVPCFVLEDIDTRACPAHNPDAVLHGANLAYLIYTSGSTGRPKGVGNRHDALYNRLEWMQRAYALRRGETVLQKTPFSFDVSVWEFFWPLRIGARLAIAAPDAHRDPALLAATMRRHAVSTLHFVPSMLQAFIDSGAASGCGESLTRIVCSGEALSAGLRQSTAHALPSVALHNLYGPTEAAIDVTAWTCVDEAARAVPIGRPIDATQTWVLDARLSPVPPGVPGELYLGGANLARGYLGRAALTAERFVPDPFGADGARLYRTGDVVRWREDGALDYLGRVDHQVKIRGLRIELGEIESALLGQGVREAVVMARDDRLIAWVTGAVSDADALRIALARTLPDYMVPWRIVPVDVMPLNANGKVDRHALPQPAFDDAAPFEAPHEGIETELAAVWSTLLGVERIGRHDDFFDLGGHSLLAVQLNARIGLDLGASLPLATLFNAPTLAAQAALVAQTRSAQPSDDALSRLDLFMDTL